MCYNSMMSAPESARYTRDEPSLWTELRELTDIQLNQHGYTSAAAREICAVLYDVDGESLEAARYYGLGLAMGHIASRLAQPGEADAVATATSDYIWGLVHMLPDRDTRGARVSDLRGLASGSMVPDVYNLAKTAVSTLPQTDKLLTEILSTAAADRLPTMMTPSTEQPRRELIRYQAGSAVDGQGAAMRIASAIFGGSGIVLRYALQAKQTGRIEEPASIFESGIPSIRDFMSPEQVKDMDISRVAKIAAKLRLDELTVSARIEDLLYVTDDRKLGITTDWLRQAPPPRVTAPDGKPSILHQERLRCPAIHVGGLIDRVLALQEDVVVDLMQR